MSGDGPGLSLVSRTGRLGSVANLHLFASGQRVASWSDEGQASVLDASTGALVVTLASPRARIWALEPEGPLAIVRDTRDESGPEADIELWDLVRGVSLTTLLATAPDTSHLGAVVGRSIVALVRNDRTRRQPPTLFRFDRAGRALDQTPLGAKGYPLLAGPGGPSMFWDLTLAEVELVDPVTAARTVLESGLTDMLEPGRAQLWTTDAERVHLACFAGSRARTWDIRTGARIRGPWEGRELRQAFFVASAFCAVAPGSTFTTYTPSGAVIAAGGEKTEPDTRPRPAIVDDRHVAFRTASQLGVCIWDVVRGVEVARLDPIGGLGPITTMSGCRSGRVALSDGREVVVVALGLGSMTSTATPMRVDVATLDGLPALP